MSGSNLDVGPFVDPIPHRGVPMPVLALGGLGIALGLLGAGYGLATNPAWFWGAWLVATVFMLGLSQGGVLFSISQSLTWARWGRGGKRIGEAIGLFMPVAYLMLLVYLLGGTGLLGGGGIYPWVEGNLVTGAAVSLEPHSPAAYASKPMWLTPSFLVARQAGAFALLLVLDLLYLRAAFGPDLAIARERLGDKVPGWWSVLSGTSDAKQSDDTQKTLGAIIAILYSLVFSFCAFDLMMSLDPNWYANMFGAWFMMSSFWLGLVGVGAVGLISRDWLGLGRYFTPRLTHDLGKMTFALCLFWAYTSFAQLLPIWYSNMPEETGFLLLRLSHPTWAWLARTVGVLCFLMPFTVLLSRGIKKMRWPYVGILVVIATGIFLERTLVVLPSVYLAEGGFPWLTFLVVSVGLWLGALGTFAIVVSYVLSKVPTLVIGDPKLETHPWEIHAHSLDAGHAHH